MEPHTSTGDIAPLERIQPCKIIVGLREYGEDSTHRAAGDFKIFSLYRKQGMEKNNINQGNKHIQEMYGSFDPEDQRLIIHKVVNNKYRGQECVPEAYQCKKQIVPFAFSLHQRKDPEEHSYNQRQHRGNHKNIESFENKIHNAPSLFLSLYSPAGN